MSYQITTTSNFAIDGEYLNAGQRAFVRDAHVVVIDGETVGTASLRQFVKDARMHVISGGAKVDPGIPVTYHTLFAIEGPAAGNVIAANPNGAHVIDGRPGIHPIIAARQSAFFEIATVPQETPP